MIRTQVQSYTASLGFAGAPVDTLAVYCSDGRFARQCEQFVSEQLQVGRCDRLVVPGGPAALVEPEADHAAMASARFLIDAHDIGRIVLIMHADCGYYTHRRRLTGEAQRQAQHEDLAAIAGALHTLRHDLRIECFLARLDADQQHVVFMPLTPLTH